MGLGFDSVSDSNRGIGMSQTHYICSKILPSGINITRAV